MWEYGSQARQGQRETMTFLMSILLFRAGEGRGEDFSHLCPGPHGTSSSQIQAWIRPPKRDLHFSSPTAAQHSGQHHRGSQGTDDLYPASLTWFTPFLLEHNPFPLALFHEASLRCIFYIHLFSIILWAGSELFYPLLDTIGLSWYGSAPWSYWCPLLWARSHVLSDPGYQPPTKPFGAQLCSLPLSLLAWLCNYRSEALGIPFFPCHRPVEGPWPSGLMWLVGCH